VLIVENDPLMEKENIVALDDLSGKKGRQTDSHAVFGPRA